MKYEKRADMPSQGYVYDTLPTQNVPIAPVGRARATRLTAQKSNYDGEVRFRSIQNAIADGESENSVRLEALRKVHFEPRVRPVFTDKPATLSESYEVPVKVDIRPVKAAPVKPPVVNDHGQQFLLPGAKDSRESNDAVGQMGEEEALHTLVRSSESQYSAEDRLELMMHYLEKGSLLVASEATGIPYYTAKSWIVTKWWAAAAADYRRRMQDELDGSFSQAIKLSINAIVDRVENGDTVVTARGEKKRVPMKGRELATVLSLLFDKREVIRNGESSLAVGEGSTERMKALEDKFKAMSGQLEATVVNPKGHTGPPSAAADADLLVHGNRHNRVE